MSLPENYGQIKSFEDALRLCKRSFVSVFVFSLFCNLLMLTPIFYMINVFSKAVGVNSMPTLISLMTIACFLYFVMWLLEMCRSRVLVYVSSRLDLLISPRVYDICFSSEAGSFNQKLGVQPLLDVNALRQFVTGPTALVLFDLPWIPIYLLIMLFFHPVLAGVALACMFIMFLVALANQRATTESLRDANKAATAINTQTQRNLRNAEAAAAMGMMSTLLARWRGQQDDMLELQVSASNAAGIYSAAIKTLNVLMQSIAITTGAILAMQQQISPGVMIGAALLLGRSLAPIQQGVSGWKNLVDARVHYDRLNQLLKDLPQPGATMKLPAITGAVRSEAVTIVPPGSKIATLKNVSFNVPAGALVMIFGASAAGKSTLIRAILGIWKPNSGAMRIDGAEAHSYDRDELGPQIGYLPQDIELFDGSIAENIARFGEVDPEAVVTAATQAGIHELVLSLPRGYDTPVSGASGNLSPGQRQRVGLARALYKMPKLIVLDEPNSNLDENGERALFECLKLIKNAGSTVFMVSHRQNVLPISDYLIILDKGTVRDQGPTAAVVAKLKQQMADAAAQKQPASNGKESLAAGESNAK